MFEGFRYRAAAGFSLSLMEQRGRISKAQRQAMDAVAASQINVSYGKALLASGAAVNKHAAAAAVFARLAVVSERTPRGVIPSELWEDAAREAIVHAGSSEADSFLALAHLMSDIREQHEQPVT